MSGKTSYPVSEMSQRLGQPPESGSRPGFGRGRRLFRLRHRHRTVMMGQGAITVGRRLSCDVVISDMQVSREHARIIIGEQSAAVEDLASINGVFVNGKRVRGMQRLSAGDRIGIGDEVIEVLGFAEPSLHPHEEPEETNIGRHAVVPALMDEDHDPIPTLVKNPKKP